MPEFYMIIARKNFFPIFFFGGAHDSLCLPHCPPVSNVIILILCQLRHRHRHRQHLRRHGDCMLSCSIFTTGDERDDAGPR